MYSRITGYYRPISNWNDGKAKEYDMRKEYVINQEDIKYSEPEKEKNKEENKKTNKVKGYLLFGTKTCPNCKIAKEKLKEKNLVYEYIDAEEMIDLTQKYDIMSAPTLIRINDEGYDKVVNASNIINFVDHIQL